ncbi:MAG: bifunctional oligoribonuclease/PAP phosphatase NrnA [Haloarculaceae archaeon]
MARVDDLLDVLGDAGSLLVVCHDDPDPDCIASALALREIAASRTDAAVTIAYGGHISHQQNRTLVNILDIEMERWEDVTPGEYDRIALVDHSDPSVRSGAAAAVQVDVVVDHHPSPDAVDAPFVDVREEYGATTSICVEYLRDLDLELTAQLASAAIFALHRERLDYMRNPTVHEYEAALYVRPHADMNFLEQFYGAAFSPSTLDAIGEAIRHRTIRGSSLVTGVGRTAERDALPQAADYLLNLEGVSTVLVYGIVGDTLYLSARSVDPRIDTGEVLREAFGDVGTAGGHADMAGAQLPLGIFADAGDDEADLVEFVSRRVVDRFFQTLHLEEDPDEEPTG